MKLRFWQRTYILTLILFLACLYAGFFGMAAYTHGKNMQDTLDKCSAEYNYIASSFERDLNDLGYSSDSVSRELLIETYAAHYMPQNIFFIFTRDGKTVYSSFEGDIEVDMPGIQTVKQGGKLYCSIKSDVDSEYEMHYLRDITPFESEFRSVMLTYVLVATGVSAVLAIVLLLLLKRLSVPIERLRDTTEKISSGDMRAYADDSGSDEFADLARSFNIMVDRINDQMAHLSDEAKKKQMLVDNMAHEMRTPLTSIRGYAEYISMADVDENELGDALMRITNEADRLRKISEKILDTAYIRENGVEMKDVDMQEIIKDVASGLEMKAGEKNVALHTETCSCTVKGDATLLMMLVFNLTENAIKACSAGGNVRLSCGDNAVTVTDDGKGMTEEQIKHITEPFYRTDKSRSRAEGGAGLGLALCKQIVESMGASMSFSSEAGRGTEVKINFEK